MIQGIGINADSNRIDGNLSVLAEDLQKFLEAGFDYVEIAAHSLDVIIHGKLVPSRLKEVKKLLSSFNLKYTLHGPDPVNLMDPVYGSLHEQVLSSCLELGSEIEAGILVYHCGHVVRPPGMDDGAYAAKYAERQAWERDALSRLGDRARELGITICVENALYTPEVFSPGDPFSAARVDHLVSHVQQIGHGSVQICLDVGHAHISANVLGFDLTAAVRQAQPHVRHLHLHDNFGLFDPGQHRGAINQLPFGYGDLHLSPGEGNIPYDVLKADLRACAAVALVELSPRYQTPERLRSTADYLRVNFM